MKKSQKLTHLRATGTTSEFCCVPLCSVTSRYNKVLSFFSFPANEELRRQWILAVRRENLTIKGHTRVCSRHFKPEDIGHGMGRRRLKKGAVPALFEWNNFSLPLPRPGVWERMQRPPPLEDSEKEENTAACTARITPALKDHDYVDAPEPAVVDLVLEANETLREELRQLQEQVESLTVRQRFGIYRFAASDKDIRFFTRFASYECLMRFWTMIEPSLPSMVSVHQGQRGTALDSTPTTRSLLPIDEFFMFLNYLALGSKQRDLADRYGVHQSTVSRIITTWSNFLFTVLGSIRIWIPEEQIQKNLPADFKDYPDTTVILDCTELRCQCPSSPLLQSEVFSSYKSHCTLKGLIGMAPHGAVTFVSGLYTGSISDEQITRESGLLALLKPGMAVMVDRGFLIDDVVPCRVYKAAFLSGRSQVSAVDETQATARLRLHVERLILRVKEHKLFDSEIPGGVFGIISQLYTVACLLTNYEDGPLVKAG
ncbi:uncharacterized protein LOC106525482 [Austrofundulus limnaeus]|uniref:Uncharacterized protein LOC106525482 n=1 Tax=Austrofundulus limnaeus TaxID=52670 RepID=A0A2I4C5D0_AUSLI|nr:PREDICTED: uncharacterized protein LOC106525482 [Austrofundulus limnaeus]